jgi:hypothetical protein
MYCFFVLFYVLFVCLFVVVVVVVVVLVVVPPLAHARVHVCVCTVLLPPGVNPTAVNKYIISFHTP